MKKQSRRSVLKSGGLLAALSGAAFLGGEGLQAEVLRAAAAPANYQGVEFAAFRASLEVPVEDSDDFRIVGPDHAESGTDVPLIVYNEVAQSRRIDLWVDGSQSLWLATLTFAPGLLAQARTRARMDADATVHALVEAAGKCFGAANRTRVGHAVPILALATGSRRTIAAAPAPEAVQSRRTDNMVELRLSPPEAMTYLAIKIHGRMALQCRWGPAASATPLLQVRLNSLSAGGEVEIFWTDRNGSTDRRFIVPT